MQTTPKRRKKNSENLDIYIEIFIPEINQTFIEHVQMYAVHTSV